MNDPGMHSFHHETDGSGSVRIRPFRPDEDLNGAFQCFEEGFRHILWPLFDQADHEFNLDLIRLFHRIAPDSWVAEVNGEVHGLLCGAIPVKPRPVCRAAFFAVSRILPAVANPPRRMTPFARRHVLQLMIGYLPHLYLQPRQLSITEIMLFTSRRRYRGRGLGKRLMDVFIREAAERGKKEALVCTDTSLSYWFYENYGFGNIRSFPMKAYRYSLPGETHRGLIYRFDLRAFPGA